MHESTYPFRRFLLVIQPFVFHSGSIDRRRKSGIESGCSSIGSDVHIPGFLTERYKIKAGDTLWKLAGKRKCSCRCAQIIKSEMDSEKLPINHTIILPKRVTWPIIDGNRPYDFNQMERDIRKLKQIYPFCAFILLVKCIRKAFI